VSARSALTRGSGSLAFVLIHPKVQLGTGAVQGVRRLSEVQGCEPEQGLKDYYCRCVQSRRFNTSKGLNVCRKECMQDSLKDLELVELRRYRTFEKPSKSSTGACAIEWLEGVASLRVDRQVSTEEHLVLCRDHQGRTDGRNSLRRFHETL
jgi:hypothetical protein